MESYDSFPQPPSEDVILGTPEGRNLSPVRRFFCLLITFDLLFTSLLWSLCVILTKGEHNLIAAFEEELLSYSLEISLFDIVMCAGCRFVILILFYAVISSHHWVFVAFTTAASCVFLVAKVLLFEWNEYSSGSPWPVLLVLSSFFIAWVEAWFLDFRVIPIERQAAIYLSRQVARGPNGVGVIPWLGAQRVRTPGGIRSYPDSISQFYSPLESPYQSDDENDLRTEAMERRKTGKSNTESVESKLWIQQGPIMASDLVTKIKSSGWVLEKSVGNGDTVYSKKLHRKIYKISGTIQATPNKIIHELFNNVERMPNWSPSVSYCELLEILNETTDVSYQVSKEGAGGLIAPRDFVTLRHHKTVQDGSHVLAWISVKHSEKPVLRDIIRGTNGIGGWHLTPSVDNERHTDFNWLLDVELELSRFIPNKVVDTAFVAVALDTVSCLRCKLSYTVEPAEDMMLDYPSTSMSQNGQSSHQINPDSRIVSVSMEGVA